MASTRTRSNTDISSPPLKALTLATQAARQASLLRVMVDTYVALEKLIQHDRAEDAETLAAKRAGLCSLMRSLNGEMVRQVDGLVVSTGALRLHAAQAMGLELELESEPGGLDDG